MILLGRKWCEVYHRKQMLHAHSSACSVVLDATSIMWHRNGLRHRSVGKPAFIRITPNAAIIEYCQHGIEIDEECYDFNKWNSDPEYMSWLLGFYMK